MKKLSQLIVLELIDVMDDGRTLSGTDFLSSSYPSLSILITYDFRDLILFIFLIKWKIFFVKFFIPPEWPKRREDV